MSENNTYFEVIQNRLDTLVYKIIQKEQSDEDFRITYAQILEKINTKIDLFSNGNASDEIKNLSIEISQLMQSRQDIFDAKFTAIKAEFDNLNKLLSESLKTPELLAAFNKIQNQIHYLTDEQDSQKLSFNSVISHIQNFGSLENTNSIIESDFAILSDQNTVIKEKIDELLNFNRELETNNKKALEHIASIILKIKELNELTEEKTDDTKTFIADRIDSVITKIHESDASIEILNNNLNTLIEVVGNLFEDESFELLKDDVASIISKTEILTDLLKQIATKNELEEISSKNKEDLKQHNLKLIAELESSIFSKLNVDDITNIKNYAEKIFYQGTEVLKDEIWQVKDIAKSIESNSTTIDVFNKNIQDLREDITDIISEESVATSQQIKEVSDNISAIKEDLTDIILEESVATSQQIKEVSENISAIREELTDIILEESDTANKQVCQVSQEIENLKQEVSNLILNEQTQRIDNSIQDLKSKFVTQLVQVADNISFDEQAEDINDCIVSSSESTINCIDENAQRISSQISQVKEQINNLKTHTDNGNKELSKSVNNLDTTLKIDVAEEIKELKNRIQILTNGLNEENKDYSYTLPDVETDIAKIRLDLSNLRKTLINPDSLTEDLNIDIATRIGELKAAVQKMQDSPITQEVTEIKGMFSGLTEDISSISKRTNKLIISSDEVSKKLLSNITAFTSLMNAFEKQSRSFYNSAFLKDVYKKIDLITKSTESLVKANQAVNEAFVYMGEWIDTASDSFDNLQNDVSKIKKNLVEENEQLSEKIESFIGTITKRIDEQDQKIEQIITNQSEAKEVKSLLEYVASQVSVTNEKMIENEQLTQKILNMEKQLKKIEKNIAIITEYIDDDDNYDE